MLPFSYLTESILSLFYPICCEACDTKLSADENVICLNCIATLPLTTSHLAEQEAMRRLVGRVAIQHAIALTYFSKDGIMQKLLHLLKYKNRKSIAHFLGKLLAHELNQLNWKNNIDIIIPVPLFKKKEALRGYNQSQLIATTLGEQFHIPTETKALKRIVNTASQTKMNRVERNENTEDAFQVVYPERIKDKNILLLDDVLTTGATIEACCKVLHPHCESISIAVVAITKD